MARCIEMTAAEVAWDGTSPENERGHVLLQIVIDSGTFLLRALLVIWHVEMLALETRFMLLCGATTSSSD